VHIHVKVRVFTAGNESYEFTSQFFFDEAFTDQVYGASGVWDEGAGYAERDRWDLHGRVEHEHDYGELRQQPDVDAAGQDAVDGSRREVFFAT
jgi:hypothetical protein